MKSHHITPLLTFSRNTPPLNYIDCFAIGFIRGSIKPPFYYSSVQLFLLLKLIIILNYLLLFHGRILKAYTLCTLIIHLTASPKNKAKLSSKTSFTHPANRGRVNLALLIQLFRHTSFASCSTKANPQQTFILSRSP